MLRAEQRTLTATQCNHIKGSKQPSCLSSIAAKEFIDVPGDVPGGKRNKALKVFSRNRAAWPAPWLAEWSSSKYEQKQPIKRPYIDASKCRQVTQLEMGLKKHDKQVRQTFKS